MNASRRAPKSALEAIVDEAIRVAIRQRAEEHGVHDAEDRGVGADAEREGEHRDGGEALVATHVAQAVPDVADQTLERGHPALVALGLLHGLDGAEAPERVSAGVVRREAGRHGVAFGQLEVGPHVLVELAIQPIALEQRQQSLPRAPHGLASRKRATSAVASCQPAISMRSCFVPAFVSS